MVFYVKLSFKLMQSKEIVSWPNPSRVLAFTPMARGVETYYTQMPQLQFYQGKRDLLALST